MVKLLMNKGVYVILVRNVRRVRFTFVLVMHKLRTAGNVGKKGNVWMVKLLMNKGV